MADSVIELSICLSDLDKNLIVLAGNQKKYINNVTVSEMQTPDQYGNTHTVYVSYKATDGKWYKNYIGKGKVKTFGGQAPVPPPPAQAPAPQAPAAPQRPAPRQAAPAPAPTQIPPYAEEEVEDLGF